VKEALLAALAPPTAKAVLDAALVHAGLAQVPEDPVLARRFVRHALDRAIVLRSGREAADAVLERLEPMMAMAESQVQANTHAARGRAGPRAVLIASLDPNHATVLGARLGPGLSVTPTTNVLELMVALEAQRDRQPIVVIDGVLPPVEPISLTAMLPHDVPGLTVVLWGIHRDILREIEAGLPTAQQFFACGAGSSVGDLVELLEGLPG
jgi:hypothetical protein